MLKSTEKWTNNVYKTSKNVPLDSSREIFLIFSKNYEKINIYIILLYYKNMWIEFKHPSLEETWDNREHNEHSAINQAHIEMNDALNTLWYGYMVSADESMSNFVITLRGLKTGKWTKIHVDSPISGLNAVNKYITAFIEWLDPNNIDPIHLHISEQVPESLQISIENKITSIMPSSY